MAVLPHGTADDNNENSDANTVTYAATVDSGGADRILMVGVTWQDTGLPSITGGSYNGDNFTAINVAATNDGNARLSAICYLVAPDTATDADLTINFSGDYNTTAACWQPFTGADQSSPNGGSDSDGTSGTTATCSLGSPGADDYGFMILLKANSGSDSLAVGSGGTEIDQQLAQLYRQACSREAGTGAGTMTWTWSTTRSYVASGMIIAAAAGGTEVAVGLASETDTALGVTAGRTYAVGLASELDTALGVTAGRIYPVGLSSETDTALGVTAGRIYPVGLASELDTAFALTAARAYPVGLASELDTAFAVVVSGPAAIVAEGLEFSLDSALVHYTLGEARAHWTLTEEN